MRANELSLSEAAEAIAARTLSPVELTEATLDRIASEDGELGAYVLVLAGQARAAAAEAEREIAAGRYRGPLHGIPFAVKDLYDVAGLPTTASSRAREGHRAERDSALVTRLLDSGAVLLGKTHTHEFAYGLTTPQTRNAVQRDRVAGGSSGGSAVAVAAGMASFALGTDTGGSIRVPAALNGITGFKPSYGALSLDGVTPLSWSLDHAGALTRTVRDAALVDSVLRGTEQPAQDLRGLRIGVPVNYYLDRVDASVADGVRTAVDRLREHGAEPVEVELPMTEYIHAIHWGLMVPEASAYHDRLLHAAPERYGTEVRVLLEAGESVSATDYLRARRTQAVLRRRWEQLFERIDVLATPTVPTGAVPAGQHTVDWPDGGTESVTDAYVRLTVPANLTGLPALTLPVGADRSGMPAGLQLIGGPGAEHTVLDVALATETASARTAAG
ncbi:amidase [Sciscionella sediminilitoris]|uniref:amidase n=1 Tax=Sciscionella sediminilitoris TaxID=1445613 RepID=UPI0004DEE7EF|nr:amidase [Sciscionella sp. SE31]